MERVETLLQKLNQQFTERVPAAQLMMTVQMLHHELAHVQASQPASGNKMVTVSMPVEPLVPAPASASPLQEEKQVVAQQAASEEKVFEILQVDEAAVEAELEEIKRNAAVMQKISVQSKPQLMFESLEEDIPTLIHQSQVAQAGSREINDTASVGSTSVNDVWKEAKPTVLAEKLTDVPVKDLKKAIGINDRFLYLNELFRGDEAMYERSIKTINSFAIWPEAEYWIRRELKTKLGWSDADATVQQFDQLVKRRFS